MNLSDTVSTKANPSSTTATRWVVPQRPKWMTRSASIFSNGFIGSGGGKTTNSYQNHIDGCRWYLVGPKIIWSDIYGLGFSWMQYIFLHGYQNILEHPGEWAIHWSYGENFDASVTLLQDGWRPDIFKPPKKQTFRQATCPKKWRSRFSGYPASHAR